MKWTDKQNGRENNSHTKQYWTIRTLLKHGVGSNDSFITLVITWTNFPKIWYLIFICYSLPSFSENTNGVIRSHQSRTNRAMQLPKENKKITYNHLLDTAYKKYRLSNTKPTKNQGWTRISRNCKQFVLHYWHPSCHC